jgi:hypothetical protein
VLISTLIFLTVKGRPRHESVIQKGNETLLE